MRWRWWWRMADSAGFTVIELITTILLLAILAATAIEKWPTGMDTEAATLEFVRAVRHAQHVAMTREAKTGNPWGIVVAPATSRYTVQRLDGTEKSADFDSRLLLENAAMTIGGGPPAPATGLWFNSQGEPVDDTETRLAASVTYTIAGTESVTVCPQTGYLMRGAVCP